MATYTIFADTMFYMNNIDCLDVVIRKLPIETASEYVVKLLDLRNDFKCKKQPDEDQALAYIREYEPSIDEDNITLFHSLVKEIFGMLININKHHETLQNKQDIQNKKQSEKDEKQRIKDQLCAERIRIREEQQMEKDKIALEKLLKSEEDRKQREIERLRIKQLRDEDDKEQRRLKQLAKEEKIRDQAEEREERKAYNSEVIECEDCGVKYIRGQRAYHYSSNDHQSRMNAIEWFKNKLPHAVL